MMNAKFQGTCLVLLAAIFALLLTIVFVLQDIAVDIHTLSSTFR